MNYEPELAATVPLPEEHAATSIESLTRALQEAITQQQHYRNFISNQARRIEELEAMVLQTQAQAQQATAPTGTQADHRRAHTNVAAAAEFRMPSNPPPKFSGNLKHRPAHELQNVLDDYLDRTLEMCRIYNFAPDMQSKTHNGQPTYVQFAAMGLSDQARIAWRRIPEQKRALMNWDEYKAWIYNTFGSTLTLSQAVDAMDCLRQTGSALVYSAAFNEITSAIEAAGIKYPVQHLCIKYLN
ncbi:hypothetical protein HDU82_005406, partial [Entophlyctis luteolus]